MTGQRIFYTIAMIAAAGIAGWLLRRSQGRLPLSVYQRFAVLAGALVGAVVAAKLPFVWGQTELGYGAWFADGKTILWALAGGYVGVEVTKWALHIRVRTGDSFVVPVALAIAAGRIGCLMFGCCYGTPTHLPWGIHFVTAPDLGTVTRHPTQLYELAFHATAALLAWTAIRHRVLVGRLMPLYVLAYCAYRFLSEFIRPEETLASGLTFYQWSAIGIAIGMTGVLVQRSFESNRSGPALEPERS